MPARSARAHNWRREEGATRHGHSGKLPLARARAMEYGAVLLVSSFAWVLYWNTLSADFAYDDSRAIKTNQDLVPSTPVGSLFRNDFWGTPLTHSGSHKSYRPLCVLSFRLNYALSGLDPYGYHLVNVVLHSMVAGLFTHMASLVFLQRPLPTYVAGLLFAVHPIHTEAVAGVVGRADVGACLFFLMAMLSYMTYCKYRDKFKDLVDTGGGGPCSNWVSGLGYHSWEGSPPGGTRGGAAKRWLYLYASLAWAACSMLTKEHGITVLTVCALYDAFVQHRLAPKELLALPLDKRYQGLREGLLHLLGAAVVLVGARLHLMGSKPPDFAPADNPAADSESVLTRALTFLYLPAFNFWLLLYPRWLSFDWSMEAIPMVTSLGDPRNLGSLLFYSGLWYSSLCLVRQLQARQYTSAFSTSPCTSCLSFKVSSPPNGGVRPPKRPLNNNCSNGVTFASFDEYSNQDLPVAKAFWSWASSPGASLWLPSSWLLSSPAPPARGDLHPALRSSSSTDALFLSMAVMILPFVPATNLFFYVGFVVAERVLYIPSMGYCLLVALGAERLYRRPFYLLWRRRFLALAFALALSALALRTIRRNEDWRTEETLYRSGIHINPPKAYGNLANILSARGRKAEAEWAYKKSLSYRSNMADVHYNLGILLQEQGRYEEALQSYRLAIQFRPRLAMAHLNLGLVLGILGKKEEAIEVYRHCSQLDSAGLKDPKMHESTKISALFNLGRLYADDAKYNKAIEVYREAVRKMPDHYQPQSLYNMMGEAYFKLTMYHDAEHWYKEALRVKPDHIPAHLTYAKLLSKWNRGPEAEEWFLKAKAIAPNDSSIYQHYGQFLAEASRHTEAAEAYVQAAELAPDEYEIVFNTANTLRQAGKNAQAEKYYYMAVKLRPNEVTSHMNLGAMLHVNGKLLEAEGSYLAALNLKPEDPITQNNLQKLRNLLVQRGLRTSSSTRS